MTAHQRRHRRAAIGAVLGLAGPAVLTWITVLVLGALLFAAIYTIAWAAVFWVLWNLLLAVIGL